jgi:alpha-L-fucosidase
VYDWQRFWTLVRRLQPNAVMFSDAGPDVRWIGNERGSAGETNWSTMKTDAVPYPGADGPGIIAALQNGDPDGTVWRPGETDVSIRPGWFYHPAEDDKVKTVDQLIDLYFTSVGRNSKLLLNVPPTRAGLLHETDVSRLAGTARSKAVLLRDDITSGHERQWRPTGDRSAVCEINLGRERTVSITDLRENIAEGQVVSQYTVEGSVDPSGKQWQPLARGTTIGYRRLDRFAPTRIRGLRVTVQALGPIPRPVQIKAY